MGDCLGSYPGAGDYPFKIYAFDWDGTAVPDRRADAAEVTAVLEALIRLELLVVVVTGTNFGNIDRQFCSLIDGPHKRFLYVCANRGSEVFGFDAQGRSLLYHRKQATPRENALLDRVAEAVKKDIESRSRVKINIVYDRLNRRKVDLIPEWSDPPKSQIEELIKRTDARLKGGGFNGGIHSAFELAEHHARRLGLTGARITSDVKHIEVGLTDKSDSIHWIIDNLCHGRNIAYQDMFIAGDEFGPVAGFEGSDFHMTLPFLGPDAQAANRRQNSGQDEAERQAAGRPVYLSVGKEPNGVPEGVKSAGGGPACFIRIMRRQEELHRQFLPAGDPVLLLVEEGYDRFREREVESLMTAGNGYLGSRGSLEESTPDSDPETLLAGVYDRADAEGIEELAVAPDWMFSRISINGEALAAGRDGTLEHRRILDMEKGILFREWRHRGSLEQVTRIGFVRFASLADPHAQLQRISVTPENYRGAVRLRTGLRLCRGCQPALELTGAAAGSGAVSVELATKYTEIKVSQIALSRAAGGFIEPAASGKSGKAGAFIDLAWDAGAGQTVTIEKFVSTFTSRDSGDPGAGAAAHNRRLAEAGLDGLLLEHARAWRRRRREAAIEVDDPESQRWLNFGCYHLISAGNARDERVSISARALTGSIYKGHIFWDAEMFILPFFIYTHPPTARAMLMYRYHTLPAGRERAAGSGYGGALFAWESTTSGTDQTPVYVLDAGGNVVPVLSGKLEHHINSAVAWGAWSYWNATGDDEFIAGPGAELLIETARFWASRVRKSGKEFHILNVEGPDEYHDEGVDDNFYTNIMARWNLRCAAETVAMLQASFSREWEVLADRLAFDAGEPARWRQIAEKICLADGDAPIEQFTGYFGLEDIDLSRYEPRTAPLDAILGHERTAASQLIKQADTVMALYLREDEVDPAAALASFKYYEPRTSHGSSLSPAIHGLVAARLGLAETAWRYFRRAARIDLSGSNAAGGIHVAAMGGLWQQVVMGFAGLRPAAAGIFLSPALPEAWRRLRFPLKWRGLRLEFEIIRQREIRVGIRGEGTGQEPGEAMIGILGGSLEPLAAGRRYRSEFKNGAWGPFQETGDKKDHGDGGSEDGAGGPGNGGARVAAAGNGAVRGPGRQGGPGAAGGSGAAGGLSGTNSNAAAARRVKKRGSGDGS